MGRPPNNKNGGANGTATTKHNNCRATKTSKVSVSKPQSSSTGSSTNNDGKSSTGKADRAQFCFPYDIRLGGFSSLLNAATKGTPKIKKIVTDECDYIMECRVCRNLFRSLPNFITHKQTFCKKVFDATWSIGLSNLIQSSDSVYNIEYEVDPQLLVADNFKDSQIESKSHLKSIESATSDKSTSFSSLRQTANSRSASNFYDELSNKLQKSKIYSPVGNCATELDSNNAGQSPRTESIRLNIKPLVERPSGTIVLQQRFFSDPSSCDIKSAHLNPTEIAQKDTAILGPDGKVIYTGPSNGIDEVVSKLTTQMQTMESARAYDACSLSISCEICKTVFDSDKALRQHKRESLDCGQTWGFKSPVADRPETPKSTSENSRIPNKRIKFSENALNKCFTYIKPKNNSHKQVVQNPKKPLSPVKKIKKKYSKRDAILSQEEQEEKSVIQSPDNSLSCNRCSRSFGTKHEMSLHLAMCNGVINYALLRNSEPAEEKIRISVRNNHDEFKLPSGSSHSSTKSNENNNSDSTTTSTISSSTESQVNPLHVPTLHKTLNKDGDTTEVNNNKQYKNGFCSQSDNKSKSKDQDCVTSSMVFKGTSNSRDEEMECDKRNDAKSDDSGISSSDSAASATNLTKQAVVSALGVPYSGKLKSPPKLKSKPSEVLGLDHVTNRLDKFIDKRKARTPSKVTKPNLRKTVTARLRKSRRMVPSLKCKSKK